MRKQRWVIAGTGHRGIGFYIKALLQDYAESTAVVGFHDANPRRAAQANAWLGTQIPVYESFSRMLDEARPDVVLVTTMDSTHHEFIIPALERDLQVITEKPLTIDAARCRRILEAERKSKGKLRITFNYRYSPYLARLKEVLAAQPIGRMHSVDITWLFDQTRGANYFRTWHRQKKNSGGLLVHKSTHHFDLVSWFLGEWPVEVYAKGRLVCYGPQRQERGVRCRTCAHQKTCEYYIDLGQKEEFRQLYLAAEEADGYYRDGCVFAPEIDAEDDLAVLVTYSGGTRLYYTLRCYSPFEAIPYHIDFQGAGGRLEAGMVEGRTKDAQAINIYPRFKPPERILVPRPPTGEGAAAAAGGRWGVARGDQELLAALVDPARPDPLSQRAPTRAGAWALLTGVAANESIRTGRPVRIDSLLPPELLGGSAEPAAPAARARKAVDRPRARR